MVVTSREYHGVPPGATPSIGATGTVFAAVCDVFVKTTYSRSPGYT